MHTKKINNTNKFMQISYHSALTKIQKLQNLKKKKKLYTGRYCRKLAGMASTWLVFKLVQNVDVSIPVYIPIRYIPVGMAGTDTVLTTLVETTTRH